MHLDFEKHLLETQSLTHVGSWEWHLASNILVWTDEHYTIFGVTRETFTPSLESALAFIHPADVPLIEKGVEHMFRDHAPFECEYRVMRSDGTVRVVYARGACSTDANGETRAYGTAQDITDRKQMEIALREAERQVRAALEDRERMVRDLHDRLIQELYAIGMSLQAAEKNVAAHPNSVTKTISDAVEGLNDVIRAARGYISAAREHNPSALETQLRAIAVAADAAQRMHVSVDLDAHALAGIPAGAYADVVAIVREAVSNSLRHSHASRVTIAVTTTPAGTQVQVEDDGCGIDPAAPARTGLGLHNMAARARALGGTLQVRPRSPRGTQVLLHVTGARV